MALERDDFEIPYYTRITGGLCPEQKVELEGLIPEQSKGFSLKFANGQHDRAKALQLKARFQGYPYMVTISILNCLQDRPRIKQSPLKPGGRFKIEMKVTRSHYEIFANGRLLDKLPHCLPPKEVLFLEMDGDVILEKLVLPWSLPAGC